jgi:hypothetical protein
MSKVGDKLAALRALMRDGKLSPSARLVGWELYERFNHVMGCSWPSQATIADSLRLDIKTVKRAIRELASHGYVEVRKGGRSNRYVPKIAERKGTKTDRDRGQKRTLSGDERGDKNGPQYPSSRFPYSNPYQNCTRSGRGQVAGSAGLSEMRGDEKFERQVIELLSRDGSDGYAIVSRLHQIDNGLPRLRLIQALRSQTCTDRDLAAAKLAAITG